MHGEEPDPVPPLEYFWFLKVIVEGALLNNVPRLTVDRDSKI